MLDLTKAKIAIFSNPRCYTKNAQILIGSLLGESQLHLSNTRYEVSAPGTLDETLVFTGAISDSSSKFFTDSRLSNFLILARDGLLVPTPCKGPKVVTQDDVCSILGLIRDSDKPCVAKIFASTFTNPLFLASPNRFMEEVMGTFDVVIPLELKDKSALVQSFATSIEHGFLAKNNQGVAYKSLVRDSHEKLVGQYLSMYEGIRQKFSLPVTYAEDLALHAPDVLARFGIQTDRSFPTNNELW
jgi:hypothetical protein